MEAFALSQICQPPYANPAKAANKLAPLARLAGGRLRAALSRSVRRPRQGRCRQCWVSVMAENGNSNVPEVIQGKALTLCPSPRSRLRLGTVRECRRELAKLYIEARRGKIETSDATRLAYLLTSLANMIRDSEMEERIEALEAEIRARR